MYEFYPYFTNDGSVGLYSSAYKDIYHSATGALTEAYEKFIFPIDMNIFLNKKQIKILDICYGIGYNTKALLNYFFENNSKINFSKKIKHAKYGIDTIYTNKIISKFINYIDKIYTNNNYNLINKKRIDSSRQYNDTLYTNNILEKIIINAVETDKVLTFLSPFIKTGEQSIKNTDLDFNSEIVTRYINEGQKISSYKINNLINYLIFDKISQNYPEIYENDDFISILFSEKYSRFFECNIRGIFKYYRNKIYKATSVEPKLSFLHNIYYRHISKCYKKALKAYPLNNVSFNLKIEDARKMILHDNNEYDLIFLDAFTPSKCPCLWSFEFLNELYRHLNSEGMLLTYSTSAAVRSAMIECGFKIGNIYNEREKRVNGTIAVKNDNLIKYPLSEYDLGLLKTTAGIFYRDKNLTGLNEAIINSRKEEVKNSDRMSSSKYKRRYKQEDSCNTMLL